MELPYSQWDMSTWLADSIRGKDCKAHKEMVHMDLSFQEQLKTHMTVINKSIYNL